MTIDPQIPDPEPAPAPQPATFNLQPSTKRRVGKVARLPKAARDKINLMILDGIPYLEIIRKLGKAAKGLTDQCLSTWKAGGYVDWLKEQQRVEDCRLSQELAMDLARENTGIESFQASNKIAAALICEALVELGADTLRKAIAADPLNGLRMLNTLSRLTTGGLKCERHLATEAERKAKLHPQKRAKRGGITPGTRRRVEKELKLMCAQPPQILPNLSNSDLISPSLTKTMSKKMPKYSQERRFRLRSSIG